MPFPFMPFGAIAALIVLGGSFTLLYLLISRLDRAVMELGGAVVGRLVAGLDDWNHDHPERSRTTTGVSSPVMTVGTPFEDATPVPVERGRWT
jgi:hypothetical protein